MSVSPWIKPTWTTVEMQSSRRWRINDTSQLPGGATLGRPTWLYAKWVPPWRVWFLESSRIFSIWFHVEICFLHRCPPFLASFSCLIPEKHIYTKTRGILSVKPLLYLYISYLCINSCLVNGLKWHLTTVNNAFFMFCWRFIIVVSDHQQWWDGYVYRARKLTQMGNTRRIPMY
jgi:hypothetical protein